MMKLRLRAGLLRMAAVLSLLLALAVCAVPQDATAHAGKSLESKGPLTPADMQERIEEAAVELARSAPLPRIGFFDMAHPSSMDEYMALAGHAVVLVTVFVQDKSELPLKRAYLNLSGGQEVELKLITSVQSKQTETGTQVSKTFGAVRADALYLLPVHLGFREANLMIDFNKSRNGFRLGTIHGSTFTLKDKLPDAILAESPSESALKQFVEREYPGFLKK
ncbi:MAG TPA: hypothetical protein VNA19_15735 [Pyrinomonadaceae bacterium]|jgi:hypothetical protein|nr:hypothetical protein [Pyrinomonadaceae bacterium]